MNDTSRTDQHPPSSSTTGLSSQSPALPKPQGITGATQPSTVKWGSDKGKDIRFNAIYELYNKLLKTNSEVILSAIAEYEREMLAIKGPPSSVKILYTSGKSGKHAVEVEVAEGRFFSPYVVSGAVCPPQPPESEKSNAEKRE